MRCVWEKTTKPGIEIKRGKGRFKQKIKNIPGGGGIPGRPNGEPGGGGGIPGGRGIPGGGGGGGGIPGRPNGEPR